MSQNVYLSLGTNLGERARNLERAMELLEAGEVRVVRRSSVYETAPQDFFEQPVFLNMVVECETKLLPIQLLGVVMSVEEGMGRRRDWVAAKGPRVIDIDVLLFGQDVIEMPGLVVPHPRMMERRFVLEPLLELVPAVVDPRSQRFVREFLGGVLGQGVVRIG